jgi:hypothetical protein
VEAGGIIIDPTRTEQRLDTILIDPKKVRNIGSNRCIVSKRIALPLREHATDVITSWDGVGFHGGDLKSPVRCPQVRKVEAFSIFAVDFQF